MLSKLRQVIPLRKIISGGQTGVDRGALDAALDRHFPCSGFCPADRRAEDGPIPGRYPMEALTGAGYRQRTRRNVQAADGTLILHFGPLEGGTLATRDICIREGKPFLCTDAETHDARMAAERVGTFIVAHGIEVLNVAGPRASRAPAAHDFAYEVILRVLTSAGDTPAQTA